MISKLRRGEVWAALEHLKHKVGLELVLSIWVADSRAGPVMCATGRCREANDGTYSHVTFQPKPDAELCDLMQRSNMVAEANRFLKDDQYRKIMRAFWDEALECGILSRVVEVSSPKVYDKVCESVDLLEDLGVIVGYE